MLESSADDIKKDFINELKDYIPTLKDKVNGLTETRNNQKEKDLKEFHRLVHTIKGASSLVKLHNLSEVASELETIIEAVMDQHLSLSPNVFDVINNTLAYFDTYSKEAHLDGSEEQNQRSDILAGLKEVRHLCAPDQSREDGDRGAATDLFLDDIDLEGDNLPADEDELISEAIFDGLESNTDDAVEEDEDEALDDIDLPQQELLEGFYQEAEDHFQDLGNALSKLEDDITSPTVLTQDHKELLRLVRRSVHTVKGAAAVIKLSAIAGWGHEFEDLLDWLYEEANAITAEDINVVAQSADMLERHVTAPQDVDPAQMDALRLAFKRIIGSGRDSQTADAARAVAGHQPVSVDPVEYVFSDEDHAWATDAHDSDAVPAVSSLPFGQAKTLRVDMTKVEALVNLAGELIIALSAFGQGMQSLGTIIGEIDRSRLRLKSTARDLELGYEVKAIQHLGSHQTMMKTPVGATNDETSAFSEFDLLELDRYSEFNLIIRSLNETAVDVSTISTQLTDIHGGFEAYLNRLRILLSELQDKVMRVRMTPMTAIVNRLRRTVRQTAIQLGKDVQFTIQGEEIELDKMVWEKLADPLMHLLRNAIDHGIESPFKRMQMGKPVPAVVQLTAAYQGNQVVIRVMDDGAGIDFNAVRRVVESSASVKNPEEMTEEELAEMIFRPGFSTREDISEVSGRGVGMDVVKENITALKGRIHLEKSKKDGGTTFQIRIPLTLAVMRALLFTVAGRLYATAMHDIKEIIRVNPEQINTHNGQGVQIGDRMLPFFSLSQHLDDTRPKTPTADAGAWPLVLIIDTGAWQGAVAIDQMHGQREIVIKNLGSHLRQVEGIAGATILGDGRIAPILNLEELLASADVRRHKPLRPTQAAMQKSLEILVVDDSVSVRTVVSRLMKRQGWKVQTAKDGVEAIERLHAYRPDLIVLDIEMPRMNGYEFMGALRAQAQFQTTPVIMLTSRAAPKHREKAKELGVNGFIIKPYEDRDFVSLVKRLSGQYRN